MSDIEKRDADRLRVMAAIYRETGDDTDEFVDLWALRESLGLSDDEMANAVNYAEGRRLIAPLRTMAGQRTPMRARITFEGVREMEASQRTPERATTSLPAQSAVFNIYGNVTGSAFQTNSAGASQHVQVGDIGGDAGDAVRTFLKAYADQLPDLQRELAPGDAAEVASDVATVQAQIDSPKPKTHIVKSCLDSIADVLKRVTASVASKELLDHLGQVHL